MKPQLNNNLYPCFQISLWFPIPLHGKRISGAFQRHPRGMGHPSLEPLLSMFPNCIDFTRNVLFQMRRKQNSKITWSKCWESSNVQNYFIIFKTQQQKDQNMNEPKFCVGNMITSNEKISKKRELKFSFGYVRLTYVRLTYVRLFRNIRPFSKYFHSKVTSPSFLV